MLAVDFGVWELADRSHAIQNWRSPIADVVFLVLGSAWIAPPENHLWEVPCAVLALLVPFFFASYGSEYLVMSHMLALPDDDTSSRTSHSIRIAVRNANLVTYGIMATLTSLWLVSSLVHRSS
jgi:hypothetical protein